jgi:hypothetical protein
MRSGRLSNAGSSVDGVGYKKSVMKIVKEDPNLMIIKDKNILAFLVGIVFTLAGFLVILKPDFFTNKPPMWSGVAGVAIGLFVVLVAKTTTITLDRITRKVVFKWKTLINEKSKEYELGSIKQLELQQVYTSSSKGRGGYSYRLVFILGTGEGVPLNPYGSSNVRIMGRQIITERGIGTRIANFLSIPFQERRPPTVSETLSTIQSAIENAAQKEIEKQKKG